MAFLFLSRAFRGGEIGRYASGSRGLSRRLLLLEWVHLGCSGQHPGEQRVLAFLLTAVRCIHPYLGCIYY